LVGYLGVGEVEETGLPRIAGGAFLGEAFELNHHEFGHLVDFQLLG
jgi:hypothetical protein